MVVPTMLAASWTCWNGEHRPAALRHLSTAAAGGRSRSSSGAQLRLLPDVGFVNAYGLTETSSTIGCWPGGPPGPRS